MRRFNRTSVRTLAVLSMLAVVQTAVSTTAYAQFNYRKTRNAQAAGVQTQGQPQLPLRFAKVTGKITNLQRSAISVSADDKSYIVQMDPRQTRVAVVGTASTDVLQPGALVQFDSVLNLKRTMAETPVEKLMVLTPSPRTIPDVISDTPKDLTKPFTVRGTIKRIVGSEMTVEINRRQIRAQLAEDAKVLIEVSDFSLVSVGDEADVKGAEVNPGLIHASDVKITLSKPLGKQDGADAEAKGKKPSRRSAASKKR